MGSGDQKEPQNRHQLYAHSISARLLTRYSIGGLLIHWTFQGMLYMDVTELSFKLALDAFLTASIGILLRQWLSWQAALLLGFMAAHSLNLAFNGQIWAVLKHYGFVSNSYYEFIRYMRDLGIRASKTSAIRKVAVYGSFSREEWLPSSDLDIRIVRHPGICNGIRACLFLLCERTRAFISRFPLDAYVIDNEKSLLKLNADEKPIFLVGDPGLEDQDQGSCQGYS